jgi:hypothetical protein
VVIAVVAIVAVVKVDRAVIVAAREARARQVHRETGNIVEIVAPVKQGTGHHVSRASKETGHHVRKARGVSARREYRVSDHRDRAENDHRVSRARRVSAPHVRRASDHRAHRETGQRGLNELHSHNRLKRLSRFQRTLFSQPLKSQRHLRRSRQHQRLVRLRANRGDSKPCYWHRHGQSTADNIAVA